MVQVQAGETLQQLGGSPGRAAAQVMQRIRELNKLDSAALDAGQTLIAPARLTATATGSEMTCRTTGLDTGTPTVVPLLHRRGRTLDGAGRLCVV